MHLSANRPFRARQGTSLGRTLTVEYVCEEAPMHITDVVWWSYTTFVVLVAVFVLWFAFKVRAKGGKR